MTEGWKEWEGKQVFLKTRSNRQYSGKVISVEIDLPLIWITLLDKFANNITFAHSEIVMIEEEK